MATLDSFACVDGESHHSGSITTWLLSLHVQSILTLEPMAVATTCSSAFYSWSNADIRGMRLKCEPADLGKVFQKSGVALGAKLQWQRLHMVWSCQPFRMSHCHVHQLRSAAVCQVLQELIGPDAWFATNFS